MISYFAKRRLKQHDRNNNRKLKSMVHSALLQQQALSSTRVGVGNDARHEIVVSLTSYAPRMRDLYLVIESLLQQSLPPDRIVLWLSPGDIPAGGIPALLQRQQARGLEIEIRDENIGAYQKIIHALESCPRSLIVTVDDDMLYPPDMVEELYQAWLARPDCIHAHRAHTMALDRQGRPTPYQSWQTNPAGGAPSALVFPTGVCGVLYFPGALAAEVLNRDQFMRLSPGADDIWLKAMSLKNGVLCARLDDPRDWKERFLTIEGSQAGSLKHGNWQRDSGNDSKLQAVFTEYDLYGKLK
ncbi:glycosyltransferase family A protein [Haliea sp. E17]|uniref:glycosyltransferase family A protein n=1 Tax=Haliea sp. E17 TaxID=3401576 RepID=UPI003AAE67FB